MAEWLCTLLPNRAEIRLRGANAFSFLQNLITQDMHLLDGQPLIYACLLTPQGKFLYDFFIRRDDDIFLIDCEGGARAVALLKHLTKYKLRSDVTMALVDSVDVYQIFRHCEESNNEAIQNDSTLKDPRHDACGYRCYSAPSLHGLSVQSMDHTHKPCDDAALEIVPFDIWDEHRIRNEIPDGSRDLIPEKSYLHESEISAKAAVSYTKGCYPGQELVSRMHHRGLAKKVLKCVEVNHVPEDTELRSQCNGVGLALLRI